MNIKDYLEDIINGIANNDNIDKITSKLQIFSRLLDNPNFTQWINNEYIYGYDNNQMIPEYRTIKACQLIASYINQSIKCTKVPVPIINEGINVYNEIMTLHEKGTISSITKAIELSQNNIYYSINPHSMYYVQKVIGYAQILESYLEFSKLDFQNIINTSRAKLIDMLMEINKQLFEEISFDNMDKKEKDIIVNNIYNAAIVNTGYGKITMNNSQAINGKENHIISTETQNNIRELLNRIESVEKRVSEDEEDIAQYILEIRQELNSKVPQPAVIKKILRALKSLKTIAMEKTIEYGIDQIIPML